MKYGTPICRQGTSTARVVVTIEKPGEPVRYVTWRGRNKKAIMRAAKARYEGCTLQFGVVLYTNSYGAH